MLRLLLLICCLSLSTAFAADKPRVLVTIKPYHSLVSMLLDGITEPELLLDGYQSPHTFQLRPRQAQSIAKADVIVWVGPTLETPLASRLRKSKNQLVIQISDDHDEAGHHHDHELDPHRWLDPVLTRKDVNNIVSRLIEAYPQYADRISMQHQRLTTTLTRLDEDIQNTLGDKKHVSALLYHNAWEYFLNRYGLSVNGVIHNSAHQAPGVRHLDKLSKVIEREKPRCLMIEPQFKPKYLTAISGDHSFEQHTLDPLGANMPTGAEMYMRLLNNVTKTFAKCQ